MARAERQPPGGATTHIALLRAINVGGHKKIAMADVRDFIAALGFHDARSILQTGNLIFRSDGRTNADLERLLEAKARQRLNLDTTFFVRARRELDAIITRNPFPDEAESDLSHLVVIFLKDTPGAPAVSALQAAIEGPEVVRADGKQLYVVYPAGIGRSRLALSLIEDKLGTRGTGRNWNTVLKIAALAATPV